MKPGLVKPETALFLETSRELLERAHTMMGVGLIDDAGRAAYLAVLHAAEPPLTSGCNTGLTIFPKIVLVRASGQEVAK